MKENITVLTIDLQRTSSSKESYKIGEFFGPVDLGYHLSKKNNSLNIGTGLFADSVLSGSNRLLFTGHSPAWEGFYISAMGGAGYVFENMDISMLSICGKAKSPSVIYLNHLGDGNIEFSIDPVDIDKVWKDTDMNEDGGVYSLMEYMLKNYGQRYKKEPRILATGPAARSTDFGAVCSAPVKKSTLSNVDTWAGRGGFGSKLFQDHGIAAIIYGGMSNTRGFRDRDALNKWFEDAYQMSFKEKDKKATAKYNYVDILKTGGTLGVNYSSLGNDLLSYNYTSVQKSEEERSFIDANFIKENYLKQFNEETIEKKDQQNCGEPCAVMCKKMHGKYKKDYEPYQAMGPLCGIFDQRAAEKLNRYSDAFGFDAISVGGVLAWLMECLNEGVLQAEDMCVTKIPKLDTEAFDVVESSNNNSQLAIELLDAIIEKKGILDFTQGARFLAKKLSSSKDSRIIDAFSYNANGENGWMVPNQYWTPGVLSPMALMGKYYMYYGNDFIPPRELGHKNAQRFIAELMIDSIGVCRFHRGWAEEMTPKIIGHLYGLEEEFTASIKSLAYEINKAGKAVFWESQKNIEIIHSFIDRKESIHYEKELAYWQKFFREDEKNAARKFWEDIYQGVQEEFEKIESSLNVA